MKAGDDHLTGHPLFSELGILKEEDIKCELSDFL